MANDSTAIILSTILRRRESQKERNWSDLMALNELKRDSVSDQMILSFFYLPQIK